SHLSNTKYMNRTIPSENCSDLTHVNFSTKSSPTNKNIPKDANIPKTLINATEPNKTITKLSRLNFVFLLTLGLVESFVFFFNFFNEIINDKSNNKIRIVEIITGKKPGPKTPRLYNGSVNMEFIKKVPETNNKNMIK